MLTRARLPFVFVCVFSFFYSTVARAQGEPPRGFPKVYNSILRDPSFKVRLQAIRVLVKQVKANPPPVHETVFGVLNEAAERDADAVVRALACFALGDLRDVRGKSTLTHALRDKEAVVRKEAQAALKLLDAIAPPPVARNVLSIGVDLAPEAKLPPDLGDVLARQVASEVKVQSGERWKFLEGVAQEPGYRLGASVSELTTAPDPGGERVSLVVRIAITTTPENHLRHVLTSRASAVSKSKATNNFRDKVLKAAVTRAVQDSLAALSPD